MSVPAAKPPRRIGDILIEQGVLSQDQLRIALTEQKKSGDQLGRIIVTLGFTTEAIVRDALSEALGQESVDLHKVVVDPEALKMVPKEVARRYRVLPIAIDTGKHLLTVAMADTSNVVALGSIARHPRRPRRCASAVGGRIRNRIRHRPVLRL